MESPKIYQIEVGVHYPFVGVDDVFEISLPLYESEIRTVVEKTKSLFWVDNDLLGSELLYFSKSATERAIKIAEETAAQIWGEQMLVKNGAEYGFFLPDEINEAIYDSPEAIAEMELRKKLREISEQRFQSDGKILKEEYAKGRWLNCLLPEPKWNNQYIYGLWSSCNGEKAAIYSLDADVLVCRKEKVKTTYEVSYRRDDVIIRIDIYSYSKAVENLVDKFILGKGKLQGHKDFNKKIIKYPRSIMLKATGISQEADLNMYMTLLDELISLKEV